MGSGQLRLHDQLGQHWVTSRVSDVSWRAHEALCLNKIEKLLVELNGALHIWLKAGGHGCEECTGGKNDTPQRLAPLPWRTSEDFVLSEHPANDYHVNCLCGCRGAEQGSCMPCCQLTASSVLVFASHGDRRCGRPSYMPA